MLTTAQLQALKAAILADSTLATWFALNNADADTLIAAAFNVAATPDFWVWRTSVSKSELTNTTSVDGTTFNWTGNGFITRSVGELTAWQELFDDAGNINASLANVRQAFTDIFSGTGNAANNRTHLSTVARRKALRGERLYTTGTGSTASPGLLVYEGQITLDQVQAARGV